MGEWRKTEKMRKGEKEKQEKIRCTVAADPSAFRQGHFHFHHTENFLNHINRHRGRERKQTRWTRSVMVDEVQQKCGGVGSCGESGGQRRLRGRDRANRSPGIQTCAA